jgi:hypothetical protein
MMRLLKSRLYPLINLQLRDNVQAVLLDASITEITALFMLSKMKTAISIPLNPVIKTLKLLNLASTAITKM